MCSPWWSVCRSSNAARCMPWTALFRVMRTRVARDGSAEELPLHQRGAAHLSCTLLHRRSCRLFMQENPPNVLNADLTAKTTAFYAYLAFDPGPCGGPP